MYFQRNINLIKENKTEHFCVDLLQASRCFLLVFSEPLSGTLVCEGG